MPKSVPPRVVVSTMFLLSLLVGLSGCGGFFTKDPNGGGGGGGGGTIPVVNYAYVGNFGASTVAGFSISTDGVLTAVPNSPYTVASPPLSDVVTRKNTFFYVGTASGIYAYSIVSTGGLTTVSDGKPFALGTVATAMDISPDGKWLAVLDGNNQGITIYAVGTDGLLSLTNTVQYAFTNVTAIPRALRFAPNGAYLFAALGTAGDIVYTFNTTTGAATESKRLGQSTTSSDNALAVDPNSGYLYIARSGDAPGLAVYAIGTGGALTALTGSPFATGTQSYGVVLDNTGTYVYVANRGESNITGYTIVKGTGAAVNTVSSLTLLGGSPFASGGAIGPLAADATGKWVLGAAYNGTPDLSLYGFSATTPGQLASVSSAATGTNANSIALSH